MDHVLFDAYGTLFDLSDALGPARDRLGDKADAVLAHWRVSQLDYAWLGALGQRYENFEVMTRMAFRDALSREGIHDDSLLDTLSASFRTVQAYDDVVEALKALAARGARTAILSNGAPGMLEDAASHAGILEHLETILSVDVVQTYKPDPDAYAIGEEYMGVERGQIAFVSSNWWDVVGARNFGYRAIWVDRGKSPWPVSFDGPSDVARGLMDLLELD